MKRHTPRALLKCSLCASTTSEMYCVEDGWVCHPCSEATRSGRTNTAMALKAKRRSDQLRVEQLKGEPTSNLSADERAYAVAAGDLMSEDLRAALPTIPVASGGEVVSQKYAGLTNTLTAPTIAGLEASSHRTELITMLGADIAAMALDAADSIQAENSLEKMLAHQLAAVHHLSMNMAHRALMIQDPALAGKSMNAAMKGFATYQGGLGALRHLRGNQQQHIVVQHVNVAPGGQALVGNLTTRGGHDK